MFLSAYFLTILELVFGELKIERRAMNVKRIMRRRICFTYKETSIANKYFIDLRL